jgi:hypothetical protein
VVCSGLKGQNGGVGTITGELSLATDVSCALWSDCINSTVVSLANYSIEERIYRRQLWEAQIAVYEHGNARGWIFWTWKTAASPLWDYRAGVALGFIPSNPAQRLYPFNPAADACLDVSKPVTPTLPAAAPKSSGLLGAPIQNGWTDPVSGAVKLSISVLLALSCLVAMRLQ